MMNNSEVKKLIEFLGISKPNTYESLRLLKEKGLVVLINTRPMTYQSTPPDIGLDMLLQNHLKLQEKAKNKAKKLFTTLDHENFIEKSPETLWHVFGGKSIKYKINDMIQSATTSIFLASSPQYLEYLENFDEKNLKLDIISFSDEIDAKEKLEKIFKDKKGNFQIVPYEAMIGAAMTAVPEGELITYKEALSMFEYENMMMLITDDSEVLFIPPVSQNSISAVNTKNKAFIMIMKIEFGSIPQMNNQLIRVND
jgi:sugar-specific transcriptional regulator TrmB